METISILNNAELYDRTVSVGARFTHKEHQINLIQLIQYQWHPHSGHHPADIPSSSINFPLITRFMGPTWGPSGANRTQVGPMLAPWTLLSALAIFHKDSNYNHRYFAPLIPPCPDPETTHWDPDGFESCIQQRKTTCLLSIRISFACARASKLTTTNMYIARARWECQAAVGSSGLNACWSWGRAVELKF